MCDQPDSSLLTCVHGIAYGCLWVFYLVPGATWNPSPPSGSSDVSVHTCQYHWWGRFYYQFLPAWAY